MSSMQTPTMLRSEQIARIVQKRRPLAQKIETVETNLRNLSDALRQLEKQRAHLLERVSDRGTIEKLHEIDCSSIQKSINDELSALTNLKSRFSRNTLNIGVVGRARQGKSRLLQSLTGLSTAEIPDGDDRHCTGVRSNIHHDPNIDETYAEVSFHTEHSFLSEVIAPYYKELSLGSRPSSIQEFADTILPSLPKELAEKKQNEAKYDHLCRYHTNIDRYRSAFSEPSPRHVSRHDIREYVAQDTLTGERIYFNYLAVKEVKIVCSFPNVDIGQIALVDMPGLGDTGIGDEMRMIKTLGQDIDLVLFVRMPKSFGDHWSDADINLYDMANSALTDLPIEEWSFMVLNHTSGDSGNRKNCESLAGSITEAHIDVQDVIIADCSNAEAAQDKILDRILNYLGERVEVLDRQYASACQDRVMQLQKTVAVELGKAKTAWKQASKDDWFPIFLELFEKFWNDLTRELKLLTSSTISKRDNEDKDFKTAVDDAIKKCREQTGIPDLETIQQKCDAAGANATAYDECLHEVRTHLSKNFIPLDIALKQSVEELKCSVTRVLKNHGKLEKLAEGDGSEFLRHLIEKLPEDSQGLRLGFQTLATFDLQYRGLLQHKIRKHLDDLTPNTTKYKLEDNFVIDKLNDLTNGRTHKSSPAKKIFDNLSKAQSEAVNKCEKELKTLLTEPSQAGFAIIEEFVDRILRAEGVRKEWQIFLQTVASDVWIDDFGITIERTQLRQDWMDRIDEVERAKQSESLNFLR
jgi:phage shock protein A